jgi:NAD(P)-dependent dehydrogenase (short-subunit alcohol dehydrogenase family)
MSRLTGKRALITGGTSGIGLETAHAFIREGARVAITGTRPESLQSAREELGSDVLFVQSNAGDIAGQKLLADEIARTFGGLDILFINAGVADFKPLEAWDEAAFDRSVATNLKGPFFLIQALLPLLANPTSIIFNASINARIGMPNTTVYAATKAGTISLVRTLSGELIKRGIRVNAVSPGPIATPLYSKLGIAPADQKAMADNITSQIPAGRFGTPNEVAQAVVFFASDESAFIVGSELIIDGGMSNL